MLFMKMCTEMFDNVILDQTCAQNSSGRMQGLLFPAIIGSKHTHHKNNGSQELKRFPFDSLFPLGFM